MTSVRIGSGVVARAATALVLVTILHAEPAVAQGTTYYACYVPSVGAMYLIKLSGLPQACLSATHRQISWTEGGAVPDGSITTAKLADGAVTTLKLSDASVTTAKLADGTVTSAKIATGATGTTQLADAAVTTSKVAAGAIGAAQLAAGAVTSDKMAFDPATQAELDAHRAQLRSSGTINDGANPVDWTQLKNVPGGIADGVDNEGTGGGRPATDVQCTGCVESADLASGAVTTSRIASGAVTTSKIASGAVSLVTYRLIGNPVTLAAGATTSLVYMTCPTGYQVLGGGWQTQGDRVLLKDSFPWDPGLPGVFTQWVYRFASFGTTSANVYPILYCARLSP